MPKKYFLVTISDAETLPYDESLLDGVVNKNHLMYLACAAFKQRKGELDPTRAAYEYFLIEEDLDNGEITRTKL
jgi:hypothetical protein